MSKRRRFTIGSVERVDMATGEVVERKDGAFTILPGPPGSCEWCHTVHAPEQPHNQQSLAYQMKFYGEHKRWPTWTDAMAHCPEDVRRMWREQLVKLMTLKGMEIPAELKG